MKNKNIETQVRAAIHRNRGVHTKDANFAKCMKQYKKLMDMGIIEKKEFSLSRLDVIGYSKYTHTV
jgi:hypothetical protein